MNVPNKSAHSVRDAWWHFFEYHLSQLVISLYFICLLRCKALSTFMRYNMQLFGLYEFKYYGQFQTFALV